MGIINFKVSKSNILLFLPLYFYFLIPVLCQNPYPNDPRDQNAAVNTFYLSSKSDCRDETKDIFNNEAVIKGYDLQNIGTGPTSCTIRVTSSSSYLDRTLKITIISMNILDCRTQLSIYDGKGTTKLGSYDCRSTQNSNRNILFTTGDTVSFIMNRGDPDSHSFNIEVRVKAIRESYLGAVFTSICKDQIRNCTLKFHNSKYDYDAWEFYLALGNWGECIIYSCDHVKKEWSMDKPCNDAVDSCMNLTDLPEHEKISIPLNLAIVDPLQDCMLDAPCTEMTIKLRLREGISELQNNIYSALNIIKPSEQITSVDLMTGPSPTASIGITMSERNFPEKGRDDRYSNSSSSTTSLKQPSLILLVSTLLIWFYS